MVELMQGRGGRGGGLAERREDAAAGLQETRLPQGASCYSLLTFLTKTFKEWMGSGPGWCPTSSRCLTSKISCRDF